jgi:hypothetical protein
VDIYPYRVAYPPPPFRHRGETRAPGSPPLEPVPTKSLPQPAWPLRAGDEHQGGHGIPRPIPRLIPPAKRWYQYPLLLRLPGPPTPPSADR